MNKVSENYLSVTALTKYLKQKFERDPYLQQVYLTGEISNFRLRANSHQYFSLKDDGAKISAIMFKGAFQKLRFTPEEGQKVLVIGRISLYEGTGNYQIYIDHMEPDGVGALYQALKVLQEKLAKEGLFSAPKKTLPHFPKRIGVITSPSGAVIRDIITTVKRRYPIAEIVLFPTLVQGNLAASNIAENIKKADSLNFDTLIIGRGGGSIEDLWPFNEEIVARAIFAANTPLISSVGHETDTTIADLVADMRAATPTAAAELAVPVLVDELQKIKDFENRLALSLRKVLQQKTQQFNQLTASYVLQQPQRLYEGLNLKLDLLTQQLQQAFSHQVKKENQTYQRVKEAFNKQDLTGQLHLYRQQVGQLTLDLNRASRLTLKAKQEAFQKEVAALNLLSPLNILSRGYSYVTTENKILKDLTDVHTGSKVLVHLANGKFEAEVTETFPRKKE